MIICYMWLSLSKLCPCLDHYCTISLKRLFKVSTNNSKAVTETYSAHTWVLAVMKGDNLFFSPPSLLFYAIATGIEKQNF